MSTIDSYRILNGTPQKRFDNARRDLESEFNETTARGFFYEYADSPSSFIIRNSRNIFSEPYFGYDYYNKFLDRAMINPCEYARELEKVDGYLAEAKKKGVSDEQLQKYQSLRSKLADKVYQNRHLSEVLGRAELHGKKDFITQYFDNLQEAEDRKDSRHLNKTFCTLFDVRDPYASLPLAHMTAVRYPDTASMLSELNHQYRKVPNETMDHYKDRCRAGNAIREMLRDPEVIRSMKEGRVVDGWDRKAIPKLGSVLLTWYEMADETNLDPKKDALAWMNKVSPEPYFEDASTNVGLMDDILDAAEDSEFAESAMVTNYMQLQRTIAYYEVLEESAEETVALYGGDDQDSFIESCEAIITEAEAQMMYLEWEDDGRPNAIIQNQIMTSKEREAARKEKEDQKASYHKNLLKEMDEADAEKKKAHGILAAIDAAKEKLEELDANGGEDADGLSARKQKICDDLKKEYGDDLNITDDTKHAFTELKDMQFMDEAARNRLNAINTTFMEGFHEDMEAARAAQKPEKKDLATRIQNKALDKEAKDIAQMAEVDEKVQKLKNAANAVSQKPKRFADSITKFCKDFDRWDDNRRKSYFVKPGFRHKLFRNLKLAIFYGSAAKLKLAYVPVAALLRHFSKTKDKRIRNELSLELENEIRICEEKISDANSAGDNERKYELMRIKDKLNAEHTRVRLNSKYI